MVKKTILIIAALSLLAATVNAGEMKMKVPVDKWRQLRTRLYSLEKENNSLKKELNSRAAAARGGETPAEKERINALEEENARLKNQAQALEEAARSGPSVDEMRQRISSLEDENRTLEAKIKASGKANKRIAALKKKNLRLKKRIQAMKSGSVTISYTGESRGARHEFFRVRHKVTDHIFSE